jgi:DNA polymerase-1
MALFGGIEIPGHPDLENIRKLDLLPIPFIRRANRLGIGFDPEYAHYLTSKFSTEMDGLAKDIASYIPKQNLEEFAESVSEEDEESGETEFNAGSPEQIGDLLFNKLGIGRDKKLKKTKTGNRISAGKKNLELIRWEHPVVPLVFRYTELKTLKKNYTVKLPLMAVLHKRGSCCPRCELPHQEDHYRIHGEMGTTRAVTGRINHKNPNLGNVSARTEDGQDVQRCFIAQCGSKLVIRDLSQIELRGLAHLSMCKSMIDIYDQDGDLHIDTCWRTGLCPQGQKPSIAQRMGAKRCNFGIQNGTTEIGLFLQLVSDFGAQKIPVPDWLTEEWCKEFIAAWLESRPEVMEFFEQCWYRARRYGRSWEPFGRYRPIPEMRSCHPWIVHSGMRYAQNFPVTALAAEQLKISMGHTNRLLEQAWDKGNGIWCWPLLSIHDAEMVEADEKYADDVNDLVGYAMDTCMQDQETGEHRFRTPIKSDGSVCTRWEK